MPKLQSINPATNEIIGEVAISTEQEIIQKVKQAHAAKLQWKLLGVQKRVEILKPLIPAFQKRTEEIVLLTTQEMGKTITESKDDLESDFKYFQHFLDEGSKYIADEITINTAQQQHKIVYEPRGVVAAIAPWNFPFSNFVWAVIPNLIVGNTVVFKHSELCPLIGKLVEEVMLDLKDLPQGVFAEIYGAAQEGELLLEQDIDMVWFTGSSEVGKKIYAQAGEKQIKAILEMGGSNPAIVFEDADLDLAVEKIFNGRFGNAGQMCDATKRVLVHQFLYENLLTKLTHKINDIKLGDPLLPTTQLGPLASQRQVELLQVQVDEAIENGAQVIIGGKKPEHLTGAYFQPTLLTDITPDMRVWREEVFGPVLPIMPFASEAEAIQLANDTVYGLSAVIYTTNSERARRVAQQIDASSIDINTGNHWHPVNPFGGFKASGMGCEHGRWGFQELCRIKVIAE